MQTFLIRRLLLMVPTLIGATLLVFLIMRVVPGDVAYLILSGEGGEGQVDPASLAKLRHELGLDRSLVVQYSTWLIGNTTGDMGKSLRTGRQIRVEIASRFPMTAQLAVMAVLMGIAVGLPLGIISALKQNSWIDHIARLVSIAFLTLPSFWMGLLVLLVGVTMFDWTPPLGRNLLWQDPGANLTQLIFPAAIIGSHLMAIVARMTRSSMLEVLREDYIRTARAKGLAEFVVITRHALKNSLIPVVTIVGISFGSLLGGTIVMEQVFTVPGIGRYLIESITFRDYPATQAIVLLLAAGFVIINLLVDFLYGFLDPRIRYS